MDAFGKRFHGVSMATLRRRDLLAGTAVVLFHGSLVKGEVIAGKLPWQPAPAEPPFAPAAATWAFFTPDEAAMVEALADCFIPPDPRTPGGKDAGCAVFIDRQLAGPYGINAGLYERPPFKKGIKQQGPQSPTTPADLYRTGLRALDAYCRQSQHGKRWTQLPVEGQNALLRGLEAGAVVLPGVDGQTFFEAVLQDVQQGFFADPIYGGNRDMCAWKMIGFPGARYDYRDWVGRHNERYPYPPVSIAGRPAWTPHGS
jgi:gluconate 2-dehydrogenase gamma chain